MRISDCGSSGLSVPVAFECGVSVAALTCTASQVACCAEVIISARQSGAVAPSGLVTALQECPPPVGRGVEVAHGRIQNRNCWSLLRLRFRRPFSSVRFCSILFSFDSSFAGSIPVCSAMNHVTAACSPSASPGAHLPRPPLRPAHHFLRTRVVSLMVRRVISPWGNQRKIFRIESVLRFQV